MFQWTKRVKSSVGRAAVLTVVLCIAGCGGTPQQRAQGYYEEGSKLLSQKDYVKASIQLKNAVQLTIR